MLYITKKIIHFFDKLEDSVRGTLSRYSIIYACIGGVSIVLFWRGIWHTADILMQKGGVWGIIFYEPTTLIWTSVIMLMTGLFVSFFIGDRIVISGLKHDKKLYEKTSLEVEEEEIELIDVIRNLKSIEKSVADLSAKIDELKQK